MRVVSFKVSESDYDSFKKLLNERGLNFTLCLGQIVHDIIVSNQKQPIEYTKYTRLKSKTLCQELVMIKETINKIIKNLEGD